jgi:hypothetical protein
MKSSLERQALVAGTGHGSQDARAVTYPEFRKVQLTELPRRGPPQPGLPAKGQPRRAS